MRFARSIIPVLFLKALTGAFLVGSTALALGQTVQVYDTEIEIIIRLYTTPVFSAAGIEPGAVRIHLVRSDEPNAFVARGQRLFVTTGLLQAAENPGQVIGVLAHETGHIAGGHLARLERREPFGRPGPGLHQRRRRSDLAVQPGRHALRHAGHEQHLPQGQ